MAPRIWVVSELYYPDETGSGNYVTGIAEGLAKLYEVNVLCAHPTYQNIESGTSNREIHNNVNIFRLPCLRLDKNNLLFRLLKDFSITLSVFFVLLIKVKRADAVLTCTSPPMFPLFVGIVCKLKGAKALLRVDDVYPHVMAATGILQPQSFVFILLKKIMAFSYRLFDRIIVMGRDMEQIVRENFSGETGNKILVITNWADVDLISPQEKADNTLIEELQMTDKFVVLIAGNIGRAQGIELIANAATELHDRKRDDIHFLFVGSGAKESWLRQVMKDRGLSNISIVPTQPRSAQNTFLNACDVALLSLQPNMLGVGAPSRFYNYMAAGKPVIAVIDEASEAALTIRSENLGWVVPPDKEGCLSEAILISIDQKEGLKDIGKRAREISEKRYSKEYIVHSYVSVVGDALI